MNETERPEGHPDGAKPGAEAPRDGSEAYTYDADKRAGEREKATNTIGGRAFFRVRKNWEVSRALRALLRASEKAQTRIERNSARIDALTEEIRGVYDAKADKWVKPPTTDEDRIREIDEKVDELEAQIDTAGDEVDEAAYKIMHLLLRGDTDAPPPIEFLKENLDTREAGELANLLATGREAVPDPTSTGTSSSS